MSNFRPTDRDTGFLMPPSVDEWLPERHLARFIVEVVEGLDLRGMSGSYRGSGSASYHPTVLLETVQKVGGLTLLCETDDGPVAPRWQSSR
jgi:transposase